MGFCYIFEVFAIYLKRFALCSDPSFFCSIQLIYSCLGGGWDSIRYAECSLQISNVALFLSQEVVGDGGGSSLNLYRTFR